MTTDSVESLRPMYMGQTASTHCRDALAYRLWASHVTQAPPSPNSIIWHRSMGGDALQLGRLDFSGLTTYGLKSHEREISTPPKLHLEYDTLPLQTTAQRCEPIVQRCYTWQCPDCQSRSRLPSDPLQPSATTPFLIVHLLQNDIAVFYS